MTELAALTKCFAKISPIRRYGRVETVSNTEVEIVGLQVCATIGDLVELTPRAAAPILAEVVRIDDTRTTVMTYEEPDNISIGDEARHIGPAELTPSPNWIGRIIDAFGRPLDGAPLPQGNTDVPLRAGPPPAAARRALGPRLRTGLSAFDTMLPLVSGQRIGIFAGSGVGKTTLLADLARGVDADVVVIGLIGERGREVRDFVTDVLGPQGMARAVVVAATSDTSPLVKRRAAWTATAIAEGLRDQGQRVLLIIDSLTRFAEAHREVALTAGEAPSLHAFPPSTAHMLASLTERAGTGVGTSGDITAIYSVLVAGSDMDGPIADIVRGLLDGHIVLDREIAERGRFPAIDVRRSVSRALPGAATAEENALIGAARKIVADYENSEVLIQTGIYEAGSDPAIDRAIALWPALDQLFTKRGEATVEASFEILAQIISSYEEPPKTQGSTAVVPVTAA